LTLRPRSYVRPPSDAYLRCLREDKSVPVDVARAKLQHEAYRAALGKFTELIALDPEPELPDACFVEDMAVMAGKVAVITKPGAASRRPEIATVQSALEKVRECRRIERGFLDGGDVLVAGSVAFVGLSLRTDHIGASELERLSGLEVRLIPLGSWLHLKTAITPVGSKTLIQARGAYPAGAFPGFEVLETDEPLGANVLAVGRDVIVSAGAPKTAALLTARGMTVHSVELSEFHAGDAGATCLSLILP
jgi:dimethylargininase